jgi:proton-coupled amino acid transporter
MEKNKKSFFLPLNGVLNTAMFLVAVMYYSIGFFGYIKYGDDCAASITINLPVENVIFQGVKLCFSVAVFITFNLQFLVGADIVLSYVYRASGRLHSLRYPTPVHNNVSEEDEQPLQGSKSKFLIFAIESSIRTLVILVIFALAIAVPRIDLFIALVGAVASSMLAIIIPSALDLWVFWPIEGYSKTKLITNVIFLVFGVYIFLAGTYTSMRDIIQYLIDKQ